MHSKLSEQNKNPVFFTSQRVFASAVVFLGVIFAVAASSTTAHAGLLSFFSMIMGNQDVSAETGNAGMADYSQTSLAVVLQASSNPGQASFSSDTPPFEGDTSLSPDIAKMNATSTEDLNTQISTYTVRQGDTISTVAKMFNVSINTILWANDLSGKSALQSGQILVILPVTGITYTVKSGDSIQGIAKKYGADVGDILNYNDLTLGSALKIGQEIIIPDAEVPTRAVSTPSSNRRITTAPYEPLLDGWGWPSYPGYYACPLPGSRLTQGLHGHNAVDLGGKPVGTPLHAVADGTVIINRSNGAWNGGYGNFVVILHTNGTQTLYAHMSKSAVYNGESVSQGQTIGYIGMTGLTTGPHVHFELRGAQNPFTDPALCR